MRGGVPLELALGMQVTIIQQGAENLLGNFCVVGGMGAGEEIIRQAKLLEEVQKAGMKALIHFHRGGAFGIRAHGNGCAVGIGARDH